MLRLTVLLIFFSTFLATARQLFQRETFRASAILELESNNLTEAIRILEQWLDYEHRSDVAHFLVAKAYLQRYLSSGDPQDLKSADDSFKRSLDIFERNPEAFYWWANLAKISARMNGDLAGYKKYIQRMRKACQWDPNNYYYYSIYFESLMGFLRDLSYLRNPLPEKTIENEIAFALQNYMRLKSYYSKEYAELLRAHFDEVKQQEILGEHFESR